MGVGYGAIGMRLLPTDIIMDLENLADAIPT